MSESGSSYTVDYSNHYEGYVATVFVCEKTTSGYKRNVVGQRVFPCRDGAVRQKEKAATWARHFIIRNGIFPILNVDYILYGVDVPDSGYIFVAKGYEKI